MIKRSSVPPWNVIPLTSCTLDRQDTGGSDPLRKRLENDRLQTRGACTNDKVVCCNEAQTVMHYP
jgi:hypothetical protein